MRPSAQSTATLDTLMEAARRSPIAFAYLTSQGKWKPARHHLRKCHWLAKIEQGTCSRLIVSEPPRHGKSYLISRYFPAWYLGRNPDKRIILATYAANFSEQWSGWVRDILAEWGPQLFGIRVRRDAPRGRWFIEGREGGMQAAGVCGPITGKGADLLIADDVVKNHEEALSETILNSHWEWWQSTARGRIESGGAAIVNMTRWADGDLAGRLIRNQSEDGDRWEQLRLPAIAVRDEYDEGGKLWRREGEALWPERWPLHELKKTRATLAPYWWAAQYQQEPGQHGSFEFPPDYFADHIWATDDEWPDGFDISVCALDPSKGKDAKRGDYSALVAVGFRGGKFWVEAAGDRWPISELANQALAWSDRHQPEAFGVEANQFQELLLPVFEAAHAVRGGRPVNWVGINNSENKILRIQRLGSSLAHRHIKLRRSAGTELLVDQLRRFPVAEHDDLPDALEMALRLIDEIWRQRQEMVGWHERMMA